MLALGKLRNMGPVEAQRILPERLLLGLPVLALFNVILSLILASLLNKFGPVLASKLWGRILLAAALCFRSAVLLDAVSICWGGGTVHPDGSSDGQAVALPGRLGVTIR